MKKLIVLLLLTLSTLSASAQFNTDRLMMTGRAALYYEDYVLSIQYFNQVLGAKPYLYEPWYFRGVAKYYLDDYVGAESDVDEAIKLNPYIFNMYDLRGLCRIKQGNYEGAIADYNKSLSINPQNQGVWYNRVLCRLETKDFTQAQLELDTLINKWSKFAAAYSLKAETFLHQKDTASADAWLNKGLEIDPYNADAWTARAMISLSRRQWKDADGYLSKALHLKPKNVSNYVNRGLARYNINNLRGALADYDLALEYDPNNFLAHYNRGLLRMQLGDDNRAILDFDYVIKMEPDNVMAIFNRAILHDKTGDLRAAISDYKAVIDVFPNFWTGLSRRAACYRRLDMTAKAELDEFKILKAQMDKNLGRQPRWSKSKAKQMRKRSEIDPEKYNQLVVADENTIEHDYKNEYRGRVQDRKVEVGYMPMFHLSFSPYKNGIKSYQTFSTLVEQLNHDNPSGWTVFVNCNRQVLDSLQSRRYLQRLESLTKAIDEAKGGTGLQQLVLERAIAFSSAQNYEGALADLDTYLQMDSTSVLALWQRAFCLSQTIEFQASHGVDTRMMDTKAMADINAAIRLDASNTYLYYDRAALFVRRKQYAAAIDDYTKAISLDPNLAEAYFNRGLVRINNGQRQEGIADLSKAGELGLYDAYSVIKRYAADKK